MTEEIHREGIIPREGKGISGQDFKTPEQQVAVLNMPVAPDASNLSDLGAEGAIKEWLLRDLTQQLTEENVDALETMVKLQRGDLTAEEQRMFQIARETLAKRKRAREHYEKDEQGFLDQTREARESRLLPKEEKEKMAARISKQYADVRSGIEARQRVMTDKLKEEPRRMIVWPFEIELISRQGTIIPHRKAKIFTAGGVRMAEAPGANVKVPESIAQWADNFWKAQEEDELRRKAMDTTRSDSEARSLWEKANEFSSADEFPTIN